MLFYFKTFDAPLAACSEMSSKEPPFKLPENICFLFSFVFVAFVSSCKDNLAIFDLSLLKTNLFFRPLLENNMPIMNRAFTNAITRSILINLVS